MKRIIEDHKPRYLPLKKLLEELEVNKNLLDNVLRTYRKKLLKKYF